MDEVELRDPIKGYNKTDIARLATIAPGFDWDAYLDKGRHQGQGRRRQSRPAGSFHRVREARENQPVDTWKAYLRWKVLRDTAPNLGKDFVDTSFGFYGTTLRGIPENQPRWKRGVNTVQQGMGDALGKLYVAKHFPASSKERADALVKISSPAFKQGIEGLDWMSPDTKREAQAKLAKFMPKIGYPDKWRDYSALEISKGDLVGNVTRANAFEYRSSIGATSTSSAARSTAPSGA